MKSFLIALFLALPCVASAQLSSQAKGGGNVLGTKVVDENKEGVQSFSSAQAWRKQVKEEVVLPEISSFMGDVAIDNIIKAEQAFCYTIEKRPPNYKGYTLDGFAITGFCGIINENLQKRIVKEFLMTSKNILFNEVADCTIEPKAIIRFVRGVDYTDVLISSPCYSYAIFYANKLKAFNASPLQGFIKSLMAAFEKKRIDFVSPAFYKQTAPIGRTFAEDEKKVEEVKEIEKVKGWNNLSF